MKPIEREGGENEAPERMKDHLVHLGESWDIWRWALLRSAGFPALLVLQLSEVEAAEAADRLLAAKEEDSALKLEAFEQSFQKALEQQSRKLFEVASEERFREAVIWQNRDAFRNAVDKLTQHPPAESPRNSQRRKWEFLVANYLQRYCMKNETIGFFGPGCWANFKDQGELLRAESGPELLASRRTYFEGWGIDALIEVLFEELGPAMKPWLRPRRDPFLFIRATTVRRIDGTAVEVQGTALRILRAADGKSTARELAARFASETGDSETVGSEAPVSPDEVYEILEQLAGQGFLTWRLEVPLTMKPGDALREELERIGDPSVRRAALGKLEKMEACRAAVAEAAGDSRALDHALENLESTFTQLTGQEARRARGRVIAVGPSRALVYEDSNRDMTCSLGPEFIEQLAPPLSIILTGARWLSNALATRARHLFQQTMTKLNAELGARAIPLVLLCQHAIPKISALGREVAAEFQSRWQRLLPVDPTLRVVAFTSDEVRPQAEEVFQATGPGWRNARYHSPDVMLAAESIEALQRGDFHFVLGEAHAAVNTLEVAAVMALHPYPEELQRAVDLDLDGPGVHTALPRFWQGAPDLGFIIPKVNTRTHASLFPTEDHILEITASSCGVPPERSLPFGSAMVEERDRTLVVPAADGTRVFDLLDVLALPLRQIAMDIFKLTPPGRHAPRVTLDRLTVQRESWSFPVSELPFLELSSEQDRFLAVRRWARQHDLPKFTFFKSPLEVKPVFLNLQSPISIEIFVKTIRRLSRRGPDRFSFTVSEMLPGPEEIWLKDAEGQVYTSELRLVAVDRKRGTR